jgi:hypothetical protein
MHSESKKSFALYMKGPVAHPPSSSLRLSLLLFPVLATSPMTLSATSSGSERRQERVTVEEENEIKRAIRDKMKELEAKGELKGPDDA